MSAAITVSTSRFVSVLSHFPAAERSACGPEAVRRFISGQSFGLVIGVPGLD